MRWKLGPTIAEDPVTEVRDAFDCGRRAHGSQPSGGHRIELPKNRRWLLRIYRTPSCRLGGALSLQAASASEVTYQGWRELGGRDADVRPINASHRVRSTTLNALRISRCSALAFEICDVGPWALAGDRQGGLCQSGSERVTRLSLASPSAQPIRSVPIKASSQSSQPKTSRPRVGRP